jgi:hypothetical protein
LLRHSLLFHLLGLLCCLFISHLFAQLFLLLTDFVQEVGHVGFTVELIFGFFGVDLRLLGAGRLRCRFLLFLGVQSFLGCLFKLGEIHLGTLWVFFKYTLVGLLPFIQDVKEVYVRFGLGAVNQVPNL